MTSFTSGAARPLFAVVTARFIAVRRQIHRRIFGEEAVWLQREPDILDRHDRKILRPADVRGAEGVPDYYVLVLDRAVLRDIFGQPIPAGMLVGEFAAGVAFVG